MDYGISSFFIFIFICHYGNDTKMNIASLLHHRFKKEQFGSFLDFKSLNHGENISQQIEEAISMCSTAIILFSPGFFKSKYCLDEVHMILEKNKPILPIFWDIDPSELEMALENNKDRFLESDMENYRTAIKKVINISGIVFQSEKQDWGQLVDDIANDVENMNGKHGGRSDGKMNPPVHSFMKCNL